MEVSGLGAGLERQAADLAAANAQFHLLFEHVPSAFALHEIVRDESGEPCDYRFLQVNPAFERLTKLKAGDLIGRTVLEVLPRTEAVWIERYGRVATTGEPVTFENYAQELGRHYQVIAYRPGPEQFAVIFQDITERVEIEEALRKAEANMAKAQAVAKLGSWERDLTTGATTWSAEISRLTGMDAGREWSSFSDYLRMVHPDDRNTAIRANTRAAETGEPATFEFRSNPDRGPVRYFEAAVEPLCDQTGRVTRLMGTLQDITERRATEERQRTIEKKILQTQKLESLGVMAGGIAHDFNNILMAVLGHAELALDDMSPGSPARDNIKEITTAARYASELCRQMLAYAGRESFALERVNISGLIDDMSHLLKTSISNKAILNLHLEKSLPSVLADPSHIRQVVMNLIINASEAVDECSGTITVTSGAAHCDKDYLRTTELQNQLKPGLYVYVEVADTGIGMDAETQERIFEPFFTTKFTGRGLGLAAVLGIVRAHKGALKVYSEPGKGTSFKVLFPAEEIPETGTTAGTHSALLTWRGRGTILLADDEETLRALGPRMLERLGFSVLTAADGREAVEIYRQRQSEIDLVLLDMTMPHMDGVEAFSRMRRLNPEVRVVLVSGYSREDVASRVSGKGLSGVLQKPYTLGSLRELLAGLLPSADEEPPASKPPMADVERPGST